MARLVINTGLLLGYTNSAGTKEEFACRKLIVDVTVYLGQTGTGSPPCSKHDGAGHAGRHGFALSIRMVIQPNC